MFDFLNISEIIGKMFTKIQSNAKYLHVVSFYFHDKTNLIQEMFVSDPYLFKVHDIRSSGISCLGQDNKCVCLMSIIYHHARKHK